MIKTLPQGVIPPMVTPFTDTLEIDWSALDELIDWYLSAGVAGLFPVSLSSECYHLTDAEKIQLARYVCQRVDGKVPVIAAGSFGKTIDEQADFINQMDDTGLDCVVIIVPQIATEYDSDDVWRANIETMLELTSSIPLGLYECPKPYKRSLTPELVTWIDSTERFYFLKDTSMQLDAMNSKIASAVSSNLQLYNAHIPTLLDSINQGAAGYCGIAANFVPELIVKLCSPATSQQEKDNLQTFLTLNHFIFRYQYPAFSKMFLSRKLKQMQPYCRRMTYDLNDSDLRVMHAFEKTLADGVYA